MAGENIGMRLKEGGDIRLDIFDNTASKERRMRNASN